MFFIAGAVSVVLVAFASGYGYHRDQLYFRWIAAYIDNPDDVDNDEQGEPIMACRGPRGSWSDQWPELRHLG